MFRRYLVIALLLAAFRSEANGTSEFPFTFRDGLLWVKVSDSKAGDTLNFILDTGAGVTTVNLDTAKRIGLTLARKVTVQGVRSEVPGYFQGGGSSLQLGSCSLPRQFLSVDLSKLSASCHCPVDGLIGADFFKNRVVEIDFESAKVRILEKAPKGLKRVRLKTWNRSLRVPISVNGHENRLMRLDTGCASPLQWVTTEVTKGASEKVSIGLLEISIPQTMTRVRIGDFAFAEVPTGIHEKAIFDGEAGLLGLGLLSRFSSITLDAKGGSLYLKPKGENAF